MSTSRLQHITLAGSVGAAIAVATVLGASGSTATPAAASHSAHGPRWYGAAGTLNSAASAGAASTSAPTSTAASTSGPASSSSVASGSDPNEPVTSAPGDEPEFVEVTATPGPCTQDDIAASRWSTRVTFTNPADAGPLDYLALAVNYYDDGENIDDFPHAGPVHLAAGEQGSIVLTGPSDYFPDSIIVGGGISADGQTAQTAGGIDLYDQADFLKVAKVCGSTTPTPDPIYDDPTDAASGSSGTTETKTRTSTVTVTATVTETRTRTVPAPRPGLGEPPTPSPVTTRLAVAG